MKRKLEVLLAGALGDALGYPVEFDSYERIIDDYGPNGLFSPKQVKDHLVITDDTQMSLFTMESIYEAKQRQLNGQHCDLISEVHASYIYWLSTQQTIPEHFTSGIYGSSLINEDPLHHSRAPAGTCLASLMDYNGKLSSKADNDSKGCGTIMRSAPFALMLNSIKSIWIYSSECSYLTHGHKTAAHSAGFYAVYLYRLLRGDSFDRAFMQTISELKGYDGHEETLDAVFKAYFLATSKNKKYNKIPEELGQGWIAEEALAIAIYCFIVADNFEEVLRLSINHDGDSDSTASLAAQLWAAANGLDDKYSDWIRSIKEYDLIKKFGEKFINAQGKINEPMANAEEPGYIMKITPSMHTVRWEEQEIPRCEKYILVERMLEAKNIQVAKIWCDCKATLSPFYVEFLTENEEDYAPLESMLNDRMCYSTAPQQEESSSIWYSLINHAYLKSYKFTVIE